MIEQDTSLTGSISLVSSIIKDNIRASEQESLLMILFKVLPERLRLDLFSDLGGPEVELLGGAAGEVDERLAHAPAVDGLVVPVELRVGLLDERDPELVGVCTVTVEGRLRLGVVRDARVHDHVLPAPVLEELEHGETKLETVVNDQVLQEVPVGREDQEGAQEPAVSKDSLLDVARGYTVLDEHGLVGGDLMGTLPLHLRGILGVLGRVGDVLVKGLVVGGELGVAEEGIVFLADLDDLGDLLLDRVFFDVLSVRTHLTMSITFTVILI